MFRVVGVSDSPLAVVTPHEPTMLMGDAAAALRALPDESVQTVVTSPPYWSLRDYKHAGAIGIDEPLPLYIKSLVTIFDQVHRVLRTDGTVWLNIGDSYTSGNRGRRAPDRKNVGRTMASRPRTPDGLKEKELIGVPWRLAFALQDAGWYLRSDIIWYKPNTQPESVRDRPTRSHEHILLLSKSPQYRYDLEAVRGPNGRRLRDVWEINTKPYPGAHDAVFPEELASRCIQIGSGPGDVVLDPFMGSGTTAAAATRLGRGWVGCEVNDVNLPLIQQRIDLVNSGSRKSS